MPDKINRKMEILSERVEIRLTVWMVGAINDVSRMPG